MPKARKSVNKMIKISLNVNFQNPSKIMIS